ncbi:MAG TPA: serine hydrolase, partial [Thermomicrobiales bacterium]|nr:serine hydrolase [Thermomicrobiales bacterium]
LGATRILSPASVAQMTTNQLTPEQRATAGPILDANRGWGFGLSVVVDPEAGSPAPGSYGWFGGFGTSWTNDPTADAIAIVMTQSVDFLTSGGPGAFWTAVDQAITT